jgi:hypothetical protein
MTDIEWGPAIAVDGKRPEGTSLPARGWQYNCADYQGWATGKYDGAHGYMWADISHIRLPADHPHYRQPAPIDWSGELEAVHEDGRVVEAKPYTMRDEPSWLRQVVAANGMTWGFDDAGQTALRGEYGWHIRNAPGHENFTPDQTSEQEAMALVREMADTYVDNIPHEIARFFERADGIVTPQPTPQADTKPDVTARMEALVRRMASETHGRRGSDYDEARAIVALLPELVDPDLIEARRLVAEKFDGGTKSLNGDAVRAGARDHAHDVQLAYSCIKRGRELALAGETGK